MTTAMMNPLQPQTWNLGSFLTATKPNTINLAFSVTNGAGESRYSSLIRPGAGAGYQVTAGKKLYLTRLIVVGSAASLNWLSLSGTADGGQNQIAAPAGASPLDSGAIGSSNAFPNGASLVATEIATIIEIAATLFPHVRCLSSSQILWGLFTGHEE